MAKFKKGDRVVYVKDFKGSYIPERHTHGTIDEDGSNFPFVRWDKPPELNPNGHAAACEDWLETEPSIPSRSIHITSDGMTTHAVLKDGGKVVKRAQAKCSPSDEYDFKTGAEYAFRRVLGLPIFEAADPKKTFKVTVVGTDEPAKPEPPAFSWDEFKAGKIAVNCKTKEDAAFFLKECEYRGHLWTSGYAPTHQTNWDKYKQETSYVASVVGWPGLSYQSNSTIEHMGYKIVTYPFYREVKRPAKIGEWVKIVKAISSPYVLYKQGEIHRVEKVNKDFNSVELDCGGDIAFLSEYVVLEGYKPKEE